MKIPTGDELRKFREKHGLTQVQAANLIYVSERQWRFYETDVNKIMLACWELIQIKVKQK
jgi:DNA-binding XRE family transcriptional regulator